MNDGHARPSGAAVVALGCCQLVAFGTSLYLLTVLGRPIAADLAWSQPKVISGFTIGVLSAAATAVPAGRLVSGGRAKAVLALSSLFLGIGLSMLALVMNYLTYVMAWVLIGVAMGGGLYDVVFGSLGRAYGSSARLAITQVAIIGGFASSIFWPMSVWLLSHLGWRVTCGCYAALNFLVCAPLYLAFAPSEQGGSATTSKEHISDRADLNNSPGTFINIAATGAAIVLKTGVGAAVSLYLIDILTHLGQTQIQAVALSVIIGPAQIVARAGELAFGRNLPAKASMALGLLLTSLGLVLLIAAPPFIILALLLYGGGAGISSVARGTLPLELFGSKRSPVIMGWIGSASLLCQAFAPPLAAIMIEAHGIRIVMICIAIVSVLNVTASLVLFRPQKFE